jgi:Spy/CpxP family protein refolding chaperone
MVKWCLSMLVLSIILAGTASAQPEGRQRGQRPEAGAGARGGILQMVEAAGVKLTDDQKVKLEKIGEETQKVMAGIREAEDRRAAMEAARPKLTELREKAMAVLTKEQQDAVQKYREEQRQRSGEGRRPEGGRQRPAPKT